MRVLDLRKKSSGVRLRSLGSYLPARVVNNQELARLGAPLDPADIARLVGIEQRHWAAADEATSDLATRACERALARASLSGADVDRLVLATVSADHPSPSAACFVQRNLRMGRAPAFDLTASCAGFLFALDAALRAVLTGERRVLAVAADIRSRFVNIEDRATAALFGDGAGAAVLEECEPGRGVLGIGLLTDGCGVHAVYVPAGGSRLPASAETVGKRLHAIRMEEGPQVYLAAIEGMAETAEHLLEALGVALDDIALVVPHQPNRRILDRLARVLRVSSERMYVNVERTGNMSGASCAVALDEAVTRGRVRSGDKVLLVAGGAGYTAGAAVLEIDEGLVASAAVPSATPSMPEGAGS